jgi:hypothetical protein
MRHHACLKATPVSAFNSTTFDRAQTFVDSHLLAFADREIPATNQPGGAL